MDVDQQNPSVHQPLLLSTKATDEKKCTCFFASSAKWILRTLTWVIFIAWLAVIFIYPTQSGNKLVEKWVGATKRTPFGLAGSLFLAFSGPLLLIVFLSILLLIISGEEEFQHKNKYPSVRLWTFPVLVDGPFGVVSAAECIGILLVLAYVIWATYAYTIRNLALLPEFHIPPGEESIWMLKLTGLRFGMIGLFCMLFLFLPIARGSFLLRLVDIPFEHATRYHVWLGHLTMMLFTLHGLFYVIGWAFEGKLLQEILEWKDVGIANLAGVISLLAGLLMWITSLHPVRKWNFELFFYTHQLYVVFLLFLAFHVGDFVFSIAAGAISLFVLDRFLRFCQSRSTVDIISAKCFPCGTMELVLSKPGNLRYNALSFIFLQIRELSWLQWHPFSVSSSPLDGKYHLSILIKVLGKWTDKLRGSIMSMAEVELQDSPAQRPTITASVEGPYGHEVPYHLMYENLILVAGGIGISPFLAILSDVLHRINDGRPCLPRNIVIVWAVKSSDELPLLSTIDMESICPHHFKRLNLEICIYVTRESYPPLEESKIQKPICTSVCPVPKGCRMSVLVGTGDNMWSGVYVISSMVGFAVLLGLLDIFYINPFHVSTWWYNGLLFVGCMLASVLIFGGLVVVLWHIWGRKSSAGDECTEARMEVEKLQHRDDLESRDLHLTNSTVSSTTVHYGSRPDFKEIFGSISKRWGHVDAGVIVCGPPALQSSVAREIRSGNLNRESRHAIIFHFHSHSFDL